MIKTALALSSYPISAKFRSGFENAVGLNVEYISTTELRTLSLFGMLRYLRTRRNECLYILIEDINSKAILPILLILAGISSVSRIEVVYPDLSRERIPKWNILLHIIQLIAASTASACATYKCQQEMTGLLQRVLTITHTPGSKRILYLNANLWFGVKAGGSVGHISGVVNGFLQKGYAVDYLAAYPNETISPKAAFHLLNPPKRYGLPYELNYFRFHRDIVEQSAAIMCENDYDFIYQRMSVDNYSGVLLSRMTGVPLVLEYNGSEAWAAKHWGKPLRFHDQAVLAEDLCLRHAHCVVTISEVLRDELIERGVPPERIVCYPNCIDPALFDPERFTEKQRCDLRAKYDIPVENTVVTFIGTFGRWHGVDKLAEAVGRMAGEELDWLRAHKVTFLLIGDGLLMSKVRELVAEAVRKNVVVLTGLVPQPEAPLYLAASDILVSPHVANADNSRFFGSPTKLFEYMAMGKGIIASDLEQIGVVMRNSLRAESLPQAAPEVSEDRLGVLTAPGDVSGLIRGVKFLVEHRDWLSILGSNVRAEALSRYTWVHHVNAILSGFHKVDRMQHSLKICAAQTPADPVLESAGSRA